MSFPRTELPASKPTYKPSPAPLDGGAPPSINTPPPQNSPQGELPNGSWGQEKDTFELGGKPPTNGSPGIAQPRQPSNSGGVSAVGQGTGGADREAIINDLVGGVKGRAQAKARSATDSFSTEQLREMRDAGVRMTSDPMVPANRQLPGARSSQPFSSSDTHARYLPESRTVHLNPRSIPRADEIRHELAHAHDHAKKDKTKFDPNASDKDRNDTMLKLHHGDAAGQGQNMRAEAKRERAAGNTKKADELDAKALEIEQKTAGTPAGFDSDGALMNAHDAYVKRVGNDKEKCFDNSAAKGLSKANTREFYAEGYNVFHGSEPGAREARDRMKQYAPELYRALGQEALKNGTTVPSDVDLKNLP